MRNPSIFWVRCPHFGEITFSLALLQFVLKSLTNCWWASHCCNMAFSTECYWLYWHEKPQRLSWGSSYSSFTKQSEVSLKRKSAWKEVITTELYMCVGHTHTPTHAHAHTQGVSEKKSKEGGRGVWGDQKREGGKKSHPFTMLVCNSNFRWRRLRLIGKSHQRTVGLGLRCDAMGKERRR